MRAARFDQDLVRALLRDQHPDLACLPLRDVDGGWDNQQWRLGEDLAVRLPRTDRAPALLDIEHAWLPVLAPRLPLPVPTPVRIGRPSARFGHPWTVARWVEGDPADRVPVTRADAARTLADFLAALHTPAPADAPANPVRGVPLSALPETSGRWSALLDGDPKADRARAVLSAALAAPDHPGPPRWLHGDLHPANVIVRGGTIAGVIDFGELCAGDPATDLSAAWLLLPPGSAARFFDAYGPVDAATVARARGWAVLRAMGLIMIGRNGRLGLPGGKPTWEPAGHAALARVLDGAEI
ncbi:aminoglycoside phosphotransferase family protein [Nocardia thailandica]